MGMGEGNDRRNDFMINLYENYATELGFEFSTPGSAVRRALSTALWSLATCLSIPAL